MTEPDDMQRYVARAKMFKALADPKRVQIVDIVTREGTMCGTQLAERLGISIALLSHHWKILLDAGILRCEQQGQNKFCTIARESLDVLGQFCDGCDDVTAPDEHTPSTTRQRTRSTSNRRGRESTSASGSGACATKRKAPSRARGS